MVVILPTDVMRSNKLQDTLYLLPFMTPNIALSVTLRVGMRA